MIIFKIILDVSYNNIIYIVNADKKINDNNNNIDDFNKYKNDNIIRRKLFSFY